MIGGWFQLVISVLAIGTSLWQTGRIVDEAATRLDGFMKICLHGGIPRDGMCECFHPWGGGECEIDLCQNGTALRHSITTPTGHPWGCMCLKRHKWHGKLCEICHAEIQTETRCLGDCLTHYYGPRCSVYCERGESCTSRGECGLDGKCRCDIGFLGNACQYETVCHRTDTYTGGTPDLSRLGNFTPCICDRYHAGPTCEDECPNECGGKGTCAWNEEKEEAYCDCDFPFSGSECQYICPGSDNAERQRCNGHGVCEDGACDCEEGHKGRACSCSPETCIHGDCSDGIESVCVCHANFTRGPLSDSIDTKYCDTCEDDFYPKTGENKCSRECKSRGTDKCEGICDLNGICQCLEGQEGEFCDECKDAYYPKKAKCRRTLCLLHRPDECQHNGTRDSCGECVCGGNTLPNCAGCQPNYFGDGCTIFCTAEDNCTNNGICAEGGCICNEGFFGPQCNQECSADTCKHGGECLAFDTSEEEWADPLRGWPVSSCVCDEEYYGQNCNHFCPRGGHGDICDGGKSKCALKFDGDCESDADCDTNFFCDDLPYPLVDACRGTWLKEAHIFCNEFLEYDYKCNESVQALTYMDEVEHTCTINRGAPFEEVCRDFTFGNCSDDFDGLAPAAPFLLTPKFRCKNPQEGFDDYLLDDCGDLPLVPAYGSASTFAEALELSKTQNIDVRYWEAGPPRFEDWPGIETLDEYQQNFSRLIFPELDSLEAVLDEAQRYLKCQDRPEGTPAEILSPCLVNQYLIEGIECPQIELPNASNFSLVLAQALLGVPPPIVKPTWDDFELIRQNLPCPEGDRVVKLINISDLGALSNLLHVQDGRIGTFTKEVEVSPRSLEVSDFFALEWKNGGLIGSLKFDLDRDTFDSLTGPEGSFADSPAECLFRQRFVHPLVQPYIDLSQTNLNYTLAEVHTRCQEHVDGCPFEDIETIKICAGFLERFETVQCAEAATADTRDWVAYDAIRNRNPFDADCTYPPIPVCTGSEFVDWETWCKEDGYRKGRCAKPECECHGNKGGDTCELECPFPGIDGSICGSETTPYPSGVCIPTDIAGYGQCDCYFEGDPLRGCRNECSPETTCNNGTYSSGENTSHYAYCGGPQANCNCLPPHTGWEGDADTQSLVQFLPPSLSKGQTELLRMYQDIDLWLNGLEARYEGLGKRSLDRMKGNPDFFYCEHDGRHLCSANDIMQAELIQQNGGGFHWGVECEHECPGVDPLTKIPCSGHGICRNGQCECFVARRDAQGKIIGPVETSYGFENILGTTGQAAYAGTACEIPCPGINTSELSLETVCGFGNCVTLNADAFCFCDINYFKDPDGLCTLYATAVHGKCEEDLIPIQTILNVTNSFEACVNAEIHRVRQLETRGKYTLHLGDDCNNPEEDLDVFATFINGTWELLHPRCQCDFGEAGDWGGFKCDRCRRGYGGSNEEGYLTCQHTVECRGERLWGFLDPPSCVCGGLVENNGLVFLADVVEANKGATAIIGRLTSQSYNYEKDCTCKDGWYGDLCDIQCTHCYLGGVCDAAGLCACSLSIDPYADDPFLGPVDPQQFCAPKGWGTLRAPNGQDPLVRAPYAESVQAPQLNAMACPGNLGTFPELSTPCVRQYDWIQSPFWLEAQVKECQQLSEDFHVLSVGDSCNLVAEHRWCTLGEDIQVPMQREGLPQQCQERGADTGAFQWSNPRTEKECWYAVHGNWDGTLALQEGVCFSGVETFCLQTKNYDLCQDSGLEVFDEEPFCRTTLPCNQMVLRTREYVDSGECTGSSFFKNIPCDEYDYEQADGGCISGLSEDMQAHTYPPNDPLPWEPRVGEAVEYSIPGPITSPSDCLEMAVRLGLKPFFEPHGMNGGLPTDPVCRREGYAALWGDETPTFGGTSDCDVQAREAESLFYTEGCQVSKVPLEGYDEIQLQPVESREECIDLQALQGYSYYSLNYVETGPNLLTLDEKQCYEHTVFDGTEGLLYDRLRIELPLFQDCTDAHPVCTRFFQGYPDKPPGCIRFWADERELPFKNGTHLAPVFAFNRLGEGTCTHDIHPT